MLYWVTYVVLVLEKAKKLNAILDTQWPSFENRDNKSLSAAGLSGSVTQ